MNKKLSIDIGVIAPILLGIFSLLGICIVAGAWLYKGQRAPAQVAATATPFRYVYLGTEPGLSTLTPEPTATLVILLPPEETDEPEFILTSEPPPIALPTTNTNNSSPTQTPVKNTAATITPTIQAVLSKVDDTYFEIIYDGEWVEQDNVTGAHQNTLHISFTAGNAALFTFVGQQVIVSYQAGPSLGSININLDGTEYPVDQSNSATESMDWRSPVLTRGTHTLYIEHSTGGSVNIDSISIPDLSTPTPTPNP
ncbi:MAG: hypothetical protein IPP66_18700 [Anaerolineales bacterium]|nr:hypothetical protein [Anaerolineales bacterium]